MSATIIDGKKIAEGIKHSLKEEIENLRRRGSTPGLAVVLVGQNPASQIYVSMKNKTAADLGINSRTITLPEATTQMELLQIVRELNEDRTVHAILIQLPLPSHIDETMMINSIAPEKDVDGFHPINRGKLMLGADTFIPCTPLGIQQLLAISQIDTDGKHVVIVGRSRIVGLPLANMFIQKKDGANATVTVCHTGTGDLTHFTRQADILIAAIGKAEFIKAQMVKEGVVVIDVGVNRLEDSKDSKGYRIVGDVEFAAIAKKASAITPVPGGVGPMTIAMLIYNTVKATKEFCASSSTG